MATCITHHTIATAKLYVLTFCVPIWIYGRVLGSYLHNRLPRMPLLCLSSLCAALIATVKIKLQTLLAKLIQL